MNWYDIEAGVRSSEEKNETQRAYCSTFMTSKYGKQVLCDMQRIVASRYDSMRTSDHVAIQIALEHFLGDILARCGVVNRMDVIKAQSEIAARYEPPAPESQLPEGYRE